MANVVNGRLLLTFKGPAGQDMIMGQEVYYKV